MALTLRAFRPHSHPTYTLSRFLGSAPSKKASASSTTQKPSTTGNVEISRWQRLKAERKAAPPPKRRIPKGLKEAPLVPEGEVGLATAIDYVRASSWAKFDESVDLAVRLNVDPRVSTQMVRTHVILPHGTGKRVNVAILDGEDWKNHVGSVSLLNETAKAKERNLKHVGVAIAPKHIAAEVAKKAGRALGPRGLLPHEKEGTIVRGDLERAADKAATRWVRLRVDKGANIHARVGRISMEASQIHENVLEVMKQISSVKPREVKRKYVLNASISSTMGRSVRLDLEALGKETRAYDSQMESL